jgi:hypothetical protein
MMAGSNSKPATYLLAVVGSVDPGEKSWKRNKAGEESWEGLITIQPDVRVKIFHPSF